MLASIRDPDQICTVWHYACICQRPRSDLHCLPLCLHLSETQIRYALFDIMLASVRDPDQICTVCHYACNYQRPRSDLHCLPLCLHLSETQIRLHCLPLCLHLSETQIRLCTVYHYTCIYQRPRSDSDACIYQRHRSDSTLFAIMLASIRDPDQTLHCLPLCLHLSDITVQSNHTVRIIQDSIMGLRCLTSVVAWGRY